MSVSRARTGGFTLLEVLIAVTIFSILTAVTVTVFLSIAHGSQIQHEESIGRQEVNNALDLLTREAGLTGYNRNKDKIDDAEPRKFAFWGDLNNDSVISLDNNPANDQRRVEKITFACDTTSMQLTRSEDQNPALLLADNVKDCLFQYFDGNGTPIDEDGNLGNGQQITLQKNRDLIRRVRLTLTSHPYNTSGGAGNMVVTRDVSLPNTAVEQLDECGQIAMDAYMTVKACNPPGERAQVTVTTYDKNGDRTNLNDVLLSVAPSGSTFQNQGGASISALIGGARDSRQTVYFVPDSTEAGTEYAVDADWTPTEAGCWKHTANAMIKVVAGDACGIQFVQAPDTMVVCQPDGYDPGVNIVVAVTDSCDNFVPDQIIQVEIVGNDAQGSLGTLEGSPASPEIRSDQYGKAYFKYRPPQTVWPNHVTIQASIVGAVGQTCSPQATKVFGLMANHPSSVVKVSPAEPILACPDQTFDMAVRVKDACGNDVTGLAGLAAQVSPPNILSQEYLTNLSNQSTGGAATLTEVDASGHATPGVYWFRLHNSHGFFSSLPVQFSHSTFPGGAISLTYGTSTACNGCTLTVASTPESAYGSGVPLNGAAADMAQIRFRGYVLFSHYAAFTITGGNGQIYTDAAGTQPYHPGDLLPLDSDGYVSVYLHNSTSTPTPIGNSINVRVRDWFTQTLQGACDQTTGVSVVCSPATMAITNQNGQVVTSANPWDPTLSTAKMIVTVSDKDLPASPNASVSATATTDTGDQETVTLTNGAGGGWVYSNGAGMGFADLATGSSPTKQNHTLQPDLVGTVWVNYTDPTLGCPTPTEQVTQSAPVDGCVNIFKMDFEDSPSDGGTWTTTYKDFTSIGHAAWNYQDWARGVPVGYKAGAPSSCPAGDCYGTNLDGDYGADGPGHPQKDYLAYLNRTSTFNTTGLAQVFIFFDMWLDMGSGSTSTAGACAFVEQKVGSGSWAETTFSSYNDKMDSNGGYNGGACWGGAVTGGQWMNVSKSLTSLLNKTGVQFRWSFYTKTSDYQAKPGWYIDNVRVCGSTRGS